MTIYEYIARSNPYGSAQVIQSYGYRIVDKKRMGDNLRQLVAQEGEGALRDIVALHPDKDIILEVYGKDSSKETFMGADGLLQSAIVGQTASQQSSDSTKLAMQTNAMLIAATVIIAAAIIVKK